jgi:hypothetical protein
LNDNDRNKRVAGDGQPHAAAAHCAAAIAALRDFALAQGRSGSDSAVSGFQRHGWFTPETRHWLARLARPKSARSGREQSQQSGLYSIISLASTNSLSDTVRSSALAVLRLIASSNLLGGWSLVLIDHTCLGQSGGLAPISLPYSRAYASDVGRIEC